VRSVEYKYNEDWKEEKVGEEKKRNKDGK